MATIQSAIRIHDGYSPIIKNMIKVNQNIISSFGATEQASGKAFNLQAIKAAQSALAQVETDFDDVERSIREADEQQKKFNRNVRNGGDFANGLKNKLLGVGAAIGAAFSAKKIIDLADTMTNTRARLNFIVDDGGSVQELEEKIMASANRARASYQTTADVVSKLGMQAGHAFSSNDELIAFSEQLNKSFVIAGADAQAVESVMYNLTQALSSGVLRGQDLNAVFSNAPNIIQNIADYLDVPIGKIREMAADGELSASVVKNAMLAAADETNARFAEMPMTWAQVWTIAKNIILEAFEPVIQTIGKAASYIYDNWSTIAPVFYGIAAAIGVVAAAYGIWKVVTLAQTVAQWALNSALLANPITWIVLAIAAVVGAIVVWINKIGGLKVAWLTAVNAIMTAWDWVKIGFFTGVYWVIDLWEKMKLGLMSAGVAVANYMGDMKANVLMILQNMVNGAIDIINGFIGVLNKLPGVSIETISAVTFGTTAQLENEAAKQARNNALDAYRADIEAGIADRQAQLNQMKADARSATADRLAQIESVRAEQANSKLQGGSAGNQWDELLRGVDDIAGNTGKMKDSLEFAEEDIRYMRDIAERDAINRYTTNDIHIDMSGMNNNINSELDLDGVVGYLNSGLEEAIVIASEGGHE
jgi:tape measure domain-containing protein